MKKLMTFALAATMAVGAYAQNFPSKPITFIVPFTAGGPTDTVARQLAEAMRPHLGNANIVVENAAGAGGTIGATRAARAQPDGYTLLVWHIGMASTPSLYRRLQFNPLQDFEFLGIINDVPMTLVGKPQLPANTYRDFENYIRANSGRLNLAHAGLGSASHICGLMWQSAINAREAMTTIPFGGTSAAMTALIGGQVDVMCDQTTNTVSQIEAGRIKAFAVTTAQRLNDHPFLRNYPSLQEMGLRNFNLTIWHGLYAPKGTPPAVTQQLNNAMRAALRDPNFIRQQATLGAIVATDNRITPEGHRAFVAQQIETLGTVIRAAGQFAD